MKKNSILSILLFSILFIGCDKKTDKSNYPIEIEITNLNMGFSSCWENIGLTTIQIINSSEEFNHYFPCKVGLSISIDFSKYSLIVFNVADCNVDSYVEKLSLQQLSANKYLFTADVIPSITANAAPLIVSVLVPKISETVSMDLVINRITDR
ncbi:MAG: hypothetical protein LBN27_05615 [Prevotellaceae bacterium]|jgi:hypothetical protein|nr:hypothetical protein [Prevotellaceae bacterium]